MNELALFAGAGGGILGGHLLGWRTVCAVEWEPYAAGVLIARQNDGILPPFPVWDDVRTFDGRAWRGIVDVVSGGFPCQDISCAGKGAGINGERSGMWVEMARIIGEVGPRYVLVENSPMLTSRGLGRVLSDLVALGYDARWGVLGADDAGAPHVRKRIWIVASLGDAVCADGERGARGVFGAQAAQCGAWEQDGCESDGPKYAGEGGGERDVADDSQDRCGSRRPWRSDPSGQGKSQLALQNVADASGGRCNGASGRKIQQPGRAEAECASEAVADAASIGEREPTDEADAVTTSGEAWAESVRGGEYGEVSDADEAACEQQRRAEPDGAEQFAPKCGGWWGAEPGVGRVANGVAARVDRLAALGNGQVPSVAALAWRVLAEDFETGSPGDGETR